MKLKESEYNMMIIIYTIKNVGELHIFVENNFVCNYVSVGHVNS
jgi:hypothetical protein